MEPFYIGVAVASGISTLGCLLGAFGNAVSENRYNENKTQKALMFLAAAVISGGIGGYSGTEASITPAQPQQAIIQQAQTPAP